MTAPIRLFGGTNANVGPFGPTRGINNKGQVAGTSNLAGDIYFHAFLLDRGTLLDLGTLGRALFHRILD